jgi:hypothetical protein
MNISIFRAFPLSSKYHASKWSRYYLEHKDEPMPGCYPPDCVVGKIIYQITTGALANVVELVPTFDLFDLSDRVNPIIGISFWDPSEHTNRGLELNKPMRWHFSYFDSIDEEEAALIRIAGKTKKEI